MEDSKFFKKLWRFNALVIAAVGILGLCAVLIALALIAYDGVRSSRTEYNTIKTEATQVITENLELGSVEPVSGTHWVITQLDSYQYYDGEYSSKSKVSSTRNLLFSDMTSGDSFWLFPDNKQLILTHSSIKTYEPSEAEDPSNKTIGMLYKLVKADSNKDGEINDDDKITIALSAPDGKNYTELPSLDDFRDYKYLKDKNQLSLMAHKDDKRHIVFVDLASFSIVKDVPLPEIQK